MKTTMIAILLVGTLALAGCASNNAPSTSGTSSGTHSLSGEGSTFVAPLMEKWRLAYGGAHTDTQISYLADGSGKGRASLIGNRVDFAGSDAPLSAAEMANATDAIHIPVAAGGVAIGYNVPGLSTPIKLDGATLASIFLGTITKWNDPAIQALNNGVPLPDKEITVVVRSDGSGTTATFTDYLGNVDSRWKKENGGPGSGSTVKWPAPSTTAANGNPGVGSTIQSTSFAIGYIGSDWTNISQIAQAQIKNSAGSFVSPTPAASSAALDAALAAGAFDAKLTGSATNAGGPESYPITAVSWVVIHQHQPDPAKKAALVGFLTYVLHDGQALNTPNNFAPMPASLVSKADALLATVS